MIHQHPFESQGAALSFFVFVILSCHRCCPGRRRKNRPQRESRVRGVPEVTVDPEDPFWMPFPEWEYEALPSGLQHGGNRSGCCLCTGVAHVPLVGLATAVSCQEGGECLGFRGTTANRGELESPSLYDGILGL